MYMYSVSDGHRPAVVCLSDPEGSAPLARSKESQETEGGERESQAQSSRCYTVSLEVLHCPKAALRVDLRQAEGQTRKVRKLKVKKKKKE